MRSKTMRYAGSSAYEYDYHDNSHPGDVGLARSSELVFNFTSSQLRLAALVCAPLSEPARFIVLGFALTSGASVGKTVKRLGGMAPIGRPREPSCRHAPPARAQRLQPPDCGPLNRAPLLKAHLSALMSIPIGLLPFGRASLSICMRATLSRAGAS